MEQRCNQGYTGKMVETRELFLGCVVRLARNSRAEERRGAGMTLTLQRCPIGRCAGDLWFLYTLFLGDDLGEDIVLGRYDLQFM